MALKLDSGLLISETMGLFLAAHLPLTRHLLLQQKLLWVVDFDSIGKALQNFLNHHLIVFLDRRKQT